MGYIAYYNGDANYDTSTGICEPLTADKLTPTVTTDVHNAAHGVITSAAVGSIIHDSATVAGSGGTPTGTVNFTFYTGTLACDNQGAASGTGIALVAGIADPSTSQGPLAAGSYSFRAHYNGDATYITGDGPCEPVTITKASPTISTIPTPASGNVGAILNDTAILSGGSSPTGNVTFTLYAPSDATCSAAPVFTEVDAAAAYATTVGYTSLVAGTYHWKAAYAGDANNNAVTSPCSDEPVVITQQVVQWCSHGYWKQSQHFDNWINYTPGQTFLSAFGKNAFPGMTLLQVLQQGGGGLNALGRDTVGELLNAGKLASPGQTQAQVISMFNAVFPGSKSDYQALQNQFVFPENCNLN